MIEKGLDQQVVLYWYQSHGRVIANEYRSKIFMVYDAARLNRSDAALVRVTSPKSAQSSRAQRSGRSEGMPLSSVKAMFPQLRVRIHCPSWTLSAASVQKPTLVFGTFTDRLPLLTSVPLGR